MKKKLDKKALFLKQAMVCGLVMEGMVFIKVIAHYTIIIFNGLLSVPATIGNIFMGGIEQLAHVFGA
jgi:hypothetical protein